MTRTFSPAWLAATAKPRRLAYGLRKRSGSLAMLAAIRRASSLQALHGPLPLRLILELDVSKRRPK